MFIQFKAGKHPKRRLALSDEKEFLKGDRASQWLRKHEAKAKRLRDQASRLKMKATEVAKRLNKGNNDFE